MDAFGIWKSASTREVFEGVLTKQELDSRFEIALEGYLERVLIELRCSKDILQTQIIPIAIEEQSSRAKALYRLQQLKLKDPKSS